MFTACDIKIKNLTHLMCVGVVVVVFALCLMPNTWCCVKLSEYYLLLLFVRRFHIVTSIQLLKKGQNMCGAVEFFFFFNIINKHSNKEGDERERERESGLESILHSLFFLYVSRI